MPKRTDIKTILIIGSGPIVIGQGCEFDYSGTQACKALREEGYQVVLVNSNPATIMTDPEFADRTYIEPITAEAVTKIIEKEKDGKYHIDALLPTLGGQTALNTACKLWDDGVLQKYGVEMIGANREVIYRAEDRKLFKEIVEGIGLKMPKAATANSLEEARQVLEMTGLPAIIRPAFTLGGTGGGIAYNHEEFEDIVKRGLDASMTHQVLIDQSVLGWKEYELEVMRDRDDNVVIICAIENVDPMGVHTGDSITVAPAQTLTDREYQRMRDASLAIIRAIGVETGGCNIQFAINPKPATKDGEMVVVEMNPRVSRSSALASKATGFPIAKIAAKLAVGYTMWELPNDITKKTVACFEPTIDYVVTKIPRWTFEKFPEADETLTTQMKSVGEAMSIGRTFKESFQKGIRSMEIKRFGLGLDGLDDWLNSMRATLAWLKEKHPTALPALQKVAGSATGTGKATVLQTVALLFHDPQLTRKLSPAARQQFEVLFQSLGAGHGSVQREALDRHSGAEQLLESTWPIPEDKLRRKLNVPSQGRYYYIRYAFKMGWTIEQVYEATMIDPWFLDQFKQLVDFEETLIGYEKLEDVPREVLFEAKQMGYSDAQLACLYLGKINAENILAVRRHRQKLRIATVYKLVDTCAAEFEAATPYYYSTYESPVWQVGMEGEAGGVPAVFDDEVRVTDKQKIIILGGGPNRIGQGIEFDYCCVQAAFAAQELGYEAVMINSNPETVSTDYDTSDLLFFEPLTFEDVLNICEKLNGKPFEGKRGEGRGERDGEKSLNPLPTSLNSSAGLLRGVIVQYGGQTPLNLAHALELAGVPIIGTSVDSIDRAGDRERFRELVQSLSIRQPSNGIAYKIEEAVQVATQIGYPVLVRPSYVLGGRAMETVYDEKQLREYFHIALGASDLADQPILIDKFLADAIECDVDVAADFDASRGVLAPSLTATGAANGAEDRPARGGKSKAIVCGVMEHIEEAGIHSGDSACSIPHFSLPVKIVNELKKLSRSLAEALQVRGLMNVQWAIKRPDKAAGTDYEIYVLEVNPRASRTVPFVSKATGQSWARIAAKVMMGKSLADLGVTTEPAPKHTSVKESVFPFSKFPGVDIILGPEMRSTGEVMGIDSSFPVAFAKSQMAAGTVLPTKGKVFISVQDRDKKAILPAARKLVELGFTLLATNGTKTFLEQQGIACERLRKISEGRPNCVDMIKNKELALIINTPTKKGLNTEEGRLRSTAVRFNVATITTATAATAVAMAIEALMAGSWDVRALQDYFQ